MVSFSFLTRCFHLTGCGDRHFRNLAQHLPATRLPTAPPTCSAASLAHLRFAPRRASPSSAQDFRASSLAAEDWLTFGSPHDGLRRPLPHLNCFTMFTMTLFICQETLGVESIYHAFPSTIAFNAQSFLTYCQSCDIKNSAKIFSVLYLG